MLPVIDYGSIAIVIPHVTAVGSMTESNGRNGFEVFLTGLPEPVIIGFDSTGEASEARDELISLVAQYHIIQAMGPDFVFPEGPEGSDENLN